MSNVANKSNVPIEACPKCSRELVGVIEVSEGSLLGLTVVVMRETTDRNWITCDACNRTICKSCCVVPDSGYCDSCFVKYKIEPYLPVV
jgi:hypothetical protein